MCKILKKILTFQKIYSNFLSLPLWQVLMEMWQSWFNAPDLKSDEGASPPGVRIPTSPPIQSLVFSQGIFCIQKFLPFYIYLNFLGVLSEVGKMFCGGCLWFCLSTKKFC